MAIQEALDKYDDDILVYSGKLGELQSSKKSKQLKDDACKADMNYRKNIGKTERSLRARVEEALEEEKVVASAYHGGDLNGVACRFLMDSAEKIFNNIKIILKEAVDEQQDNNNILADDDEINRHCDCYTAALGLLGEIFARLRIGWGEARDDDIIALQINNT